YDRAPLLPVCKAARHGTIVGRQMVRRARCGETDRTSAYCFLNDRSHSLQILRRRALGERAFTHGVGAERRMTEVPRVVDALRQPIDRVEKLRERLPTPADPRQHRLA